MGLAQIRTELHDLIDRSDEKLLQMIYAMAAVYDKEEIVAYTTSGKPLTKKDYNQRLEKAENQIASGEYISQEELEKEAENW
jgi:hypothetical protein